MKQYIILMLFLTPLISISGEEIIFGCFPNQSINDQSLMWQNMVHLFEEKDKANRKVESIYSDSVLVKIINRKKISVSLKRENEILETHILKMRLKNKDILVHNKRRLIGVPLVFCMYTRSKYKFEKIDKNIF